MSGSISTARCWPLSRTAQPPRPARWTHSEPAARTAASRAASLAGRLASRATIGADSAPLISLRSISSPVRATAGQWIREAGRALAVGAQAVDLELDRARVELARRRALLDPGGGARPDPAGAGAGDQHRLDPRQDEQLAGVVADDRANAQAERVADLESRRLEPAPRPGRGSRPSCRRVPSSAARGSSACAGPDR